MHNRDVQVGFRKVSDDFPQCVQVLFHVRNGFDGQLKALGVKFDAQIIAFVRIRHVLLAFLKTHQRRS